MPTTTLQTLRWGRLKVATWVFDAETEVNERVGVTDVELSPGFEMGSAGDDGANKRLATEIVSCFRDAHFDDDDVASMRRRTTERWDIECRIQSVDASARTVNVEVCCARPSCPGRLPAGAASGTRAGSTAASRLPVIRFFTVRFARYLEYKEIRLRRVGPFEGYEPRCHCRETESCGDTPEVPHKVPRPRGSVRRQRSRSFGQERDAFVRSRASETDVSRRSGSRNQHDSPETALAKLRLDGAQANVDAEKDALEAERIANKKEALRLKAERDQLEERRSAFEMEKSQAALQIRLNRAGSDAASRLKLDEKTSGSKSEETKSVPNTDSGSSMEIPWEELVVDTSNTGNMGVGAFGKVQRGWWLGTPVAVKLIDVIRLRSGTVLDSGFQRELQSLDRARHPNVVALLAWASRESESQMALVTEVCAESLQHALDDRRTNHLVAVLKILWDVSRAMAFLHHIGIGHRDLKPANVLLTQKLTPDLHFDGEPENFAPLGKVCDFGVAKHIREVDGKGSPKKHSVGGTELYMAPEVAANRDSKAVAQTVFVDNWAFCVVALESLENERGVQSRNHALRLIDSAKNIVRKAFGDSLSDVQREAVTDMLCKCGDDDPTQREQFEVVTKVLYEALKSVLRGADAK